MPETNNMISKRRRGSQLGKISTVTGKQTGPQPRGKGLDTDTTIDFVIDYSASMRNILGAVYLMCHDIMDYAQSGNARVQFGLTFFGSRPEPLAAFWNKHAFTEDAADIEEKMLAALVGGGACVPRRSPPQGRGAQARASPASARPTRPPFPPALPVRGHS